MNTTGKLVFALVLITGLAATGAAVELNARANTAPTIQLDAVVVTPASAPATIELAAVNVEPTQADWQYARAHGVDTPTAHIATAQPTIALAAIRVTPTQADWQYVRAQALGQPTATVASARETIELPAIRVRPTQADWHYAEAQASSLSNTGTASAEIAGSAGGVGAQILTEALNALAPGEFLNPGVALRTLGALVFGGNGR